MGVEIGARCLLGLIVRGTFFRGFHLSLGNEGCPDCRDVGWAEIVRIGDRVCRA